MKIKNDRIDLDVVAEQLESGKEIQNDRIAHDGFAFETASAALLSAVAFESEISESGKLRIIRSALFSLNPKAAITAKVLTSALARQESEYLGLPRERFALLTSVSMKFGPQFHRIKEGGSVVRFAKTLPRNFDRKPFHDIPTWPSKSEVSDYSWAVVLVDARSNQEAFEQALRDLDYLRGMWNFTLTRLTISRDSTTPLPLGDIGLGPAHTVHRARGAAVEGIFWYQPAFYPQPPVDIRRDWKRVSTEMSKIRRLRRGSAYPAILKEIFIRYARALDGVDFDSTFLKLWSIFELLTATTNARYDQSVERALFVFEEQKLNRTVLEHLRAYRNAAVHDALSSQGAHEYCWQLKQYVDALIKFHLFWSGRFETLTEAGTFLSLPKDPHALRKRVSLAKLALRYLAD